MDWKSMKGKENGVDVAMCGLEDRQPNFVINAGMDKDMNFLLQVMLEEKGLDLREER